MDEIEEMVARLDDLEARIERDVERLQGEGRLADAEGERLRHLRTNVAALRAKARPSGSKPTPRQIPSLREEFARDYEALVNEFDHFMEQIDTRSRKATFGDRS